MHVLRHYLVFDTANRWDVGGGRFEILEMNHKKLVNQLVSRTLHLLKNKTGQDTCDSSCQETKITCIEKTRKSAENGIQHHDGGMRDRKHGKRGMHLVTGPKVIEYQAL